MDEVLWATARASGVVALVLLTLSVVLGILTRGGRPMIGLPRFAVAHLHRDASLLATAFLTLHVVTLLGDSYAGLRLVDLMVPFLAARDALWQGLGTTALDLLLAVIVTALLRRRLPAAVFRTVHLAVLPLWGIALLHALGSGTDAGTLWFRVLAAASAAIVLAATLWRLLAPSFRTHPAARARRTPERSLR
ncbi:ferric reductase-like transmembrane domain-containing protein [Brachybacterium sp. SGAir0954]|uniref:ferric reductase-like transmembrane domain-containing protein n=1 Tax=Brachybacterium sp. SGAir0954 TaxID=2571029 RepID=UPI00143DF642|nr:ferric reductase-like transmembrane domain-containing protein [Brachybacterium sp. SGAir0954]